MSNFVFNIAKGSVAEKARDDNTKFGVLLLKVAEADDTLNNYDTLAALLAGANTEADFTNYGRVTAITGTLTVDDSGNAVSVDIPNPVWTAAGGATNNDVVKLVVYYEESAADTGRIPLTGHDFVVTTNGGDLTGNVAAAGFYGAS